MIRLSAFLVFFLLSLAGSAKAFQNLHALERYDVCELLVWHISEPNAIGERIAYVIDPDEYMHVVVRGSRMGKSSGRVIAIEKDHLVLINLLPDGKGGWVESKAMIHCANCQAPPADSTEAAPDPLETGCRDSSENVAEFPPEHWGSAGRH